MRASPQTHFSTIWVLVPNDELPKPSAAPGCDDEVNLKEIVSRKTHASWGVERRRRLSYAPAVPGVQTHNLPSPGFMCAFVWPDSNTPCWLNPLLSAKLALSPEPMTRNAHMAVLEAENEEKHYSCYKRCSYEAFLHFLKKAWVFSHTIGLLQHTVWGFLDYF